MNVSPTPYWSKLLAWLEPRPRALWAGSVASFVALAAIVFLFYSNTLFYRFDGNFILTLATTQRRWMAPGPGFSLNFLEGFGDIWIPIATKWCLGFSVGGLFGQRLMPVVACLVFAVEFFLSTLVLARCLGAGLVTGLAGAWLGALFTLPFFVPTLADWRLWGNPHFFTPIAVTTLSLCAFLKVGRGRLAQDLAAVLLILMLIGYFMLSMPVLAAVAGPVLAVFGGAAVITAGDGKERRRKIMAAIVLVAVLALAFGGYEVALFTYARTTFFWDDLVASPVTWRDQSFLISEGRGYGLVIWAACVSGAVLAAVRAPPLLRRSAIGFLGFLALQQLLFLLNAIVGFKWRGPSAAYLDLFVLPFYALFAGYLVLGWWCETPPRRARAIAALSLVPWLVVLLTLHRPYADRDFHAQNPFVWPPRETAITQILRAEIGLREGGLFRGRVANIAGIEFEPQYANAPLISQHNYDAAVAYNVGNEHRYFGLWYYDIPTLIQDNQFSSPFAHATISRLFSRRHQKHVRQLTTITRYDPRLYAMFGVRFLITDRPLPDVRAITSLVVNHEAPHVWTLYLYEVPQAQPAGYWSTRPMQAATVRQAIEWLAAGNTSDADAVIYEPVEASLVPGRSSEIRVFRDRLVVTAESSGASLLVLPLEFSHCFEASFMAGTSGRLLRASVSQAGLLFSGRVEIELRYRFSPWHFRCRFRDIADARRLKLADIGWPE
jgi:hypothetical protein